MLFSTWKYLDVQTLASDILEMGIFHPIYK